MTVVQEPGLIPAAIEARAFVAHMDKRVDQILAEVEQSEVYRRLADPMTSPRLVAGIMKHIMLEVYSYGGDVTEATFRSIGRMPKDRPDLMKAMILHTLSEADHREVALRDFIALGGSEAWARTRRMTPASFSMVATCHLLADREEPFAYLGYVYLFETLTPVLTARLQEFLGNKGFPIRAQKFVDMHAVEDIGHAQQIRNLVVRLVTDFPSAASAIEYGFDCFTVSYPHVIWQAALDRALEEAGQ